MVKESEKPKRSLQKFKVEYGKYKDKTLIWVGQNDLEFFKQIQTLYYSKYSPSKKKYYDNLTKRFLNKDGFGSRDIFHDKVHEVVALMRKKYTNPMLHAYLKEKYNYTLPSIIQVMGDANMLIRREFELEKSFLVDIHLIRYEEIFENCMNPDIENVPVGFKRAVLCEHYLNAMETLFQKERLLGIHTKKFKLQVNSLTPQQRAGTEFDLTKLNSTEHLEVFALLNKAKYTEQLIQPLILNNNPLDVDSSYQTEEVVIDAPIRKTKQIDEIGDREKHELKTSGKSLQEVQQAMKQTLEEKIKELFEKKKKK